MLMKKEGGYGLNTYLKITRPHTIKNSLDFFLTQERVFHITYNYSINMLPFVPFHGVGKNTNTLKSIKPSMAVPNTIPTLLLQNKVRRFKTSVVIRIEWKRT